jgi:hypothetical protein
MAADDTHRQGGAIVMRGYGGPDVLHFETVPLAALQADEVRLRSIASAITTPISKSGPAIGRSGVPTRFPTRQGWRWSER